MPVSITSVAPATTVQGGTTSTLLLQPGTVIDARVLSVLEADLVQIAIDNIAVTAQSQVPLQAGTTLQLAVSQTADGVQLTIVPETATGAGASTTTGAGQATDTSAIARSVPASDVATTPVLTQAQAAAVAMAAQSAATRQSGLSGLFANLSATVDSLPAPLQQAAANLLAGRPELSTSLNGADIQSAVQNSGLFLEAALAGGAATTGQAGSPPDLKAALLVFRQLLSTTADGTSAPLTAQAVTPAAAVAEAADPATQGSAVELPSPSLAPQAQGEEAVMLTTGEAGQIGEQIGQVLLAGTARADSPAAALNLLQEVAASLGADITSVDRTAGAGAMPSHGTAVPTASEIPPPPYRGAAPSAQAVATSSIAADAATSEVVKRLASDTDGAIARQTLLQIASLPAQGDASAADRMMLRWNFESPFSAPQGTAVAQFEISRDDGGQTASSSQRVWRARFSLNIEPTGPIHALVSLSGGATSVRLWAERPQTAAQLRASASQLTTALRQADLEPGDIVIGDGAPPLPAMTAPAGRFLDRAT